MTNTIAGDISFQMYGAGTEKKKAQGAKIVAQRHRLYPKSLKGPHCIEPENKKRLRAGHIWLSVTSADSS
jgi:hypothetical protein